MKNAIVNINFPEILLWHEYIRISRCFTKNIASKVLPSITSLLDSDLSIKYANMISDSWENEIKTKTGKGPNNSQHKVTCDSGKGVICTKACKHRGEEAHHYAPGMGSKRHPGVALIESLVELQWDWHSRVRLAGVWLMAWGAEGSEEILNRLGIGQQPPQPEFNHSLWKLQTCPKEDSSKEGSLLREVFKQLQ